MGLWFMLLFIDDLRFGITGTRSLAPPSGHDTIPEI